jgi:lysophospholipase L1-like esterase
MGREKRSKFANDAKSTADLASSLAQKVSKVNGQTPDVNGNVTINVPEVDTTNLATKTELNAVASGSPKGVYATLSSLQTAIPTGNSNVYLVTADGKWYYWNGSAWTAGGTYQATGLLDGSVSKSKVDSIIITSGKNLFDKVSMVIADQGINGVGTIATNPGWKAAKIPVEPNSTYSFEHSNGVYQASQVGMLAFLDESSAIISTIDMTTLASSDSGRGKKVITPANTAYIYKNVIVLSNNYLDTFQLELGSSCTSYESFELILKNIFNARVSDTKLTDEISMIDSNISLPATNIIKNGNFSNGVTNWEVGIGYGRDAVLGALGNTLTVTGNTTAQSGAIQGLQIVPEHLYYCRAKFRVTNSVCNSATIGFSNTGFSVDNPVINQWYTGVHVTKASSSSTAFHTYHAYANAATASGKVMEVQYVLVIDLTASFGAGKEPTAAHIEKLLSKYPNSWFDGTENYLLNIKEMYDSTLVSTSKLKGKKWAAIGDSITAINIVPKQYHTLLAEDKLIGTVYNHGIAGTGFIAGGGSAIPNRLASIPSDTNFITVFAGTNDFDQPLGVLGDTTISTVYGAIDLTINTLINAFPLIPIAMMTPLPRRGYSTIGNPIELVAKAVKEVAARYSIPVFDMYAQSGLRPWNDANNTAFFNNADGLHPNQVGHQLLASKLSAWLETVA